MSDNDKREVALADGKPWWRSHMVRWFIPTAAVAATVTVMLMSRVTFNPEVFRGKKNGVVTIAPRGQLATPPSVFSWRSFPAASFYRFELFDEYAQPVYTAVVPDTVTTLSTGISAPARGYWIVVPLNDLRVANGDEATTRYTTTE